MHSKGKLAVPFKDLDTGKVVHFVEERDEENIDGFIRRVSTTLHEHLSFTSDSEQGKMQGDGSAPSSPMLHAGRLISPSTMPSIGLLDVLDDEERLTISSSKDSINTDEGGDTQEHPSGAGAGGGGSGSGGGIKKLLSPGRLKLKKTTTWLGRLFRSGAFDPWEAVCELQKSKESPEVVTEIANQLNALYLQNPTDVEFYLPQICMIYLCLDFENQELQDFLVKNSAESFHFALVVFLFVSSHGPPASHPRYNTKAKLLMSIEAAVVNQKCHELDLQRATSTPISHNSMSPPSTSSPGGEQQPGKHEAVRKKREKKFANQLDFVHKLTDISDELRHIQPPDKRNDHLPPYLEEMNEMVRQVEFSRLILPFTPGHDEPSGDKPRHHIIGIPPKEGRVFSTRERAPVLICVEIEKLTEDESEEIKTPRPKSFQKPVNLARRLLSKTSAVNAFSHPRRLSDTDELLIRKTSLDSVRASEAAEAGCGNDDSPNPILTRCVSSPPTGLTTAKSDFDDDDPEEEGEEEEGDDEPEWTQEMMEEGFRSVKGTRVTEFMTPQTAFGESWAEKKARVRKEGGYLGDPAHWDLLSIIVKAYDDLRGEAFAMQLIEQMKHIFQKADIPLFVRTYHILPTSESSGVMETITDATSIHGLKKSHPNFTTMRNYFEETYGSPKSERFKKAQRNFASSLAASSLLCYILQIKDRHNGNILIDSEGHLCHIDFGFFLTTAPGGVFSLETAPFKLPMDWLEVLQCDSGLIYNEFVSLFVRGFLEVQANHRKLITLTEIMLDGCDFSCFAGGKKAVLDGMRQRLCLDMPKRETVPHLLGLIEQSKNNWKTKKYDQFQFMTNGIL